MVILQSVTVWCTVVKKILKTSVCKFSLSSAVSRRLN